MGDAYSKFENIIQEYWDNKGTTNAERVFWDDTKKVLLNYELLELLLTKSVDDGDSAQSGALAKGLDLWIAEELRAAGFVEEEVWPRLHEPRVVDPSVFRFVEKLPKKLSSELLEHIERSGSAEAKVQGAVYTKQVDVGMSSWLSGPEILISTKTMSRAYGKNLGNRFEEAYGDAVNLKKRYPLAAFGFFFLVNAEIADSDSDLSKAITMLRKLQEEEGAYDTSALLLVDFSSNRVRVPKQPSGIPQSLSPESFFASIVDIVLVNGPIDAHPGAHEKMNSAFVKI
ncbi:MAG: hypothetical protein ACOX69_08340 [Coriobacteriales bacterium]|jgi:hypothetical protein